MFWFTTRLGKVASDHIQRKAINAIDFYYFYEDMKIIYENL